MITSKTMSKRKKRIKKKSLHLSLAMLQLGGKLDPNNRTINGPEQSRLIPWGEVRVPQIDAYPFHLYTISYHIQGFSLALASKKASRSNLGSSKSVITVGKEIGQRCAFGWTSLDTGISQCVVIERRIYITYIHWIAWSPVWAGSSSSTRPWPARSGAPCGRTRARSLCAWRPG